MESSNWRQIIMSDYFGPKQTRVLDSENRNFEEIIYQKKKPPLSCEVNLDGKLAADKNQDLIRYIGPSGWSFVGQLKDGVQESSCCAGDIVCSSSYVANSLKLIALELGIETKSLKALVNGWEVLVQGTNSLDENNIIILPEPPSIGSRIDFVFLEVWRKLITTSDVIYKYGNLLYGGQNYQNDLIDPAINIETSLRVQLQYRVRVAECDLENYPNGFDPNKVFVQGPLSYPNNTCSHAYFSQVPGDIGLWRAGLGDSAAQEILQTVDGYTYAIPLCAVHRRNTGSYNPDNRSNGCIRTLADYLNGYPSDRPDNLYNNWIVSTDVLDMRHRISPTENLKGIAEDGFKKLIRGKIRGVMSKQTLGEDHFGTILVQADAVSNIDRPGSTRIAEGDGARRVFANATVEQPETISVRTINDKTVGTSGVIWASGDEVQIDISSYPLGSVITNVREVYISSGALTYGSGYTLSGLSTSNLNLTVPLGSPLIGTSSQLYLEYTVQFAAGPNGFSYVPEQMLEFRNEDSTMAYALPDADIRVRTSSPVITTDGTKFNMFSNRGGNEMELYDFGHQMTYHVLGNGTDIVTISRTIEGFSILGVISAKVGTAYRTLSITRTSTQYIINLGTPAIPLGQDVELKLYTGGKFFETNKQGRGIVETYEMSELRPREVAIGQTSFSVDSTSKAIIGIASKLDANGAGIAYVNGIQKTLLSTNYDLPTDHTKSIATFTFSSADTPPAGSVIEFPLLMRSAILPIEGYTLFYSRVPYQGLLDSTTMGSIEVEGPALTTTAGSGAITDLTYSTGKAFFSDSTIVQGAGTEWLSNVRTGYIIRNDATPNNEYVVSQVYSDTVLFLTSRTDMSSPVGGSSYTIIAKDQPYFIDRNIIDRLPTLNSNNDASGNSDNISTAVSDPFPVLNTRIISDVQGITEQTPNAVVIGINPTDRGRSQVQIPDAPLGVGSLGCKFEKLDSSSGYQKSYQSYILNQKNSGELYLMVVGTETDNTNGSMHLNEKSTSDTVDIFQLPGRPLTNRRHG